MEWEPFLEALVHREVEHQYMKRRLRFALTRELFSSAGVDAGTVLLLRAVHAHMGGRPPCGVTDTGCGTGTLGLSIAAATGAWLHATDRDALACWFTARNAKLNGVGACTVEPALGAAGPTSSGEAPDLAVSNLPAKAGAPVLAEMIRALPRLTTPDGVAAAVIVAPLEALLDATLRECGAEIIERRVTSQHVAVVYRLSTHVCGQPAPSGPTTGLPPCYVRGPHTFDGPFGPYGVRAVHNLPEFDSLSYATQLAFRLMRSMRPGGSALFWGVGQGHLPLAAFGGRRGEEPVYIADRDLLAVAATAANLRACGSAPAVTPLVEPALSACARAIPPGSLRWMIVNSAPSSGSRWEDELVATAGHLLRPGGHLMVASRSTALARLERAVRARFAPVDSARSRGFRVDLLVRKR